MSDAASWEMDITWPRSGTQRVYDLAQPLRHGIPHHPAHPPYAFTLTKQHGEMVYQNGVSAASELLCLGGHVGTHVDALGHISKDGRIHGDEVITDAQSYAGGVERGGIEHAMPFLAPATLLDAPRHFGRALEANDRISADVFAEWFADREPAAGSVVLVRTGWDERWDDNALYLSHDAGTPGVDLSGARWLSERGIRATGADTIAYEKLPSPALEVHVHLLKDHGIHIMEALNLRGLSADQVDEFFFVALPLRIRGGTGSPIRPIAMVPGH